MIRPVRPADHDALYDICLRTGDAGGDATPVFEDRRLLGDIFVVPYAVLEPEHAFVLDDGTGDAVGYAVGALDTHAFEDRLEAEWWPAARARHADPAGVDTIEGLFLGYLHGPPRAAADLVAAYPSHLHIDLLPAAQGQGWGRRLMETLFAALRADGSTGVHLGVSEANGRAIAFYTHLGMTELGSDGITRRFGLAL
ncbi:MAG TPA: GNAT family N-acetyltransferase [Acidimicrobiales bacterium]|nr:GNAT family N-acetyltransferase [Acidimicrobiales bacterium]